MANATCEMMWLLSLSKDLHIEHPQPALLFYDCDVPHRIGENIPSGIYVFFFFFDRKRQRHILIKRKVQEKDEESSHQRKTKLQ